MSESFHSTEILKIIFDQIENTSEGKNSRNTFYQCQLVCKSWFRSAQYKLYKNVYLSSERITCFANTIKTASISTLKLGNLVRKVEFYIDSTSYATDSVDFKLSVDIDQDLDTILQHCPYIEQFCSPASSDFETKRIWKCLLSAENIHRYLNPFASLDKWTFEYRDHYAPLALKYRDTLTKLRLHSRPFLDSMKQDFGFLSLKKHIAEFKSLEHLQLLGYFAETFFNTDLDNLINDCPKTTHSLELRNCNVSSIETHTRGIQPNSSIRKLELTNPRLSDSSIRYFANKLKALEALKLDIKVKFQAQMQTQEDSTEWWNQMVYLCMPLLNYNINIDEFNAMEWLYQIRGGAYLSNTVAQQRKASTKTNSTEFTMYINHPIITKEDYIIEMKYSDSSVRLFKSGHSQLFKLVVDFDRAFEYIQPFSPEAIRILNVQHPLYFDDLLQNFNNDSSSSLAKVLLKNYKHLMPKDGHISGLIPPCNTRNWAIFDGAISMNNSKTGSVIHLDRMIFPDCEERQQTSASMQAGISELKFTNTLFHPNVFPKMSSKLPKVDRLILDGCTIMSDSLCQLDFDFQATKLGYLELKLHNLSYRNCQITVETTDTSRVRTYHSTENGAGCASNLVISIKCKGLKKWSISNTDVNGKSMKFKQLTY
ncbi:hypothetical protein [Parasitella parasitica]|uniref:Uncharacterized protein n=1 Tax=Parasitella parasitica TaxID=35722 RepID=A0A0B7N113_9FUNG|nr:hypothetical protein [Parasitella parasitica]